MKIIPIFSALLTLFIAPSVTPSEIYQWEDEKGVRYFSDKPQNNLSAKEDSAEKELFKALPPDTHSPKEKLRLLQGEWKQVQSSPNLAEMANLLASLWQMPISADTIPPERDFTLAIKDSRITITPKPKGDSIQNNTDRQQNFKVHTAKIELYNATPLEIDGFWSFESISNPITSAFLEQTGPDADAGTRLNQVRFDLQGNQLMATVYFPEKYRIKALKIIYEKTGDSTSAPSEKKAIGD
ncbi:DUF4124 domain-containing protein [Candidatus Sororendozoicomonas aggregata]|uniref:DUF4124 domain-containing protein n=1 Tax=Candidatus Sororendozoicomonas aggregata TaxID=3073239 RepID=UPI002ED472EF